jgi:hypothetical protein
MKTINVAWIVILVAGLAGSALSRTWYVRPDGSGDAPTIFAAIDSAAAGDIIEMACGTYVESRNYSTLLMPRSGVTFRSETGDPSCVVIDAQHPNDMGCVFFILHQSDIRFEGLTVTGGHGTSYFYSSHSGGFEIYDSQNIELDHCLITGNVGKWGGGLYMFDSSVGMTDCVVTGNSSILNSAGGMYIWGSSSLHAVNTRIVNNTAPQWADGVLHAGSTGLFTCCELDLSQWFVDGTLIQEDEDCDQTADESLPWGTVKALFR